jgi:hypothetical protein
LTLLTVASLKHYAAADVVRRVGDGAGVRGIGFAPTIILVVNEAFANFVVENNRAKCDALRDSSLCLI